MKQLGNLITDGMLAKAKTYKNDVIMALQNGGGIRAALRKVQSQLVKSLQFFHLVIHWQQWT